MGVSIDTFGANFIHYLTGAIEILNNTVKAKQYAKGKKKQWEGSQLLGHAHLQRNSSVNWTVDGGAIPPSGQQGYQTISAYRKFAVGSVSITDGQLNNASTTKHAAKRVVDSELRGLMSDLTNWYNYFWTRDGTGIITLMGATASGSTFTVDDARGLWDQSSYSILDEDAPATVHDTFTVKSISRAYNNTLYSATVTPTADLAASGQAANDYVVKGTGAFTSYNRAITGLDAGIDDAASSFQGLDASVWTKYTSPVLDNSGTKRALTPALIRQMLAMLVQEGGDKTPITALGTVWLCVKMDELYESAIRITPDTTTVGGSTPTLQSSLGKVTIEPDKDSPYGKLFFIRNDAILFAVQKELHWRPVSNNGGGIFMRDNQNLRYVANALEQSELMYEARNKCGKIEDLIESVGTAF